MNSATEPQTWIWLWGACSGWSLLDIIVPDSSSFNLWGEDGWSWKLPTYSLYDLHQAFTIGNFFQVSELKSSCCNPTTIFSIIFAMDKEIKSVFFSKGEGVFFFFRNI